MTKTYLLSGFVLTLLADSVFGQVPPGYPGYNPYGRPIYYHQNRLSGQADMLNAEGGLLLDQEKGRIMREQATQEKLKTKRQTFDEMMYEKANALTVTEKREIETTNYVRRMMTDPAPTEIRDGRAANTMMPYISKLMSLGIFGPTVELQQDLLKYINVKSGDGGPELGPLRDGGKVRWPFCLRSKTTEKLDKLLPAAVDAAARGDLEPDLFRKVKNEVAVLKKELPPKYLQKQEIDTGEYLEGKHFLESLEVGVAALAKPGAQKLFNGTLKAQGNTVPELVAFMNQNGLKFAAASPGQDEAYFALHNMMVAYASAAQNSAGFRVPVAPPTSLETYKR